MSDNISTVSEALRDSAAELDDSLGGDVDDACCVMESVACDLHDLANDLDRLASALGDARNILS